MVVGVVGGGHSGQTAGKSPKIGAAESLSDSFESLADQVHHCDPPSAPHAQSPVHAPSSVAAPTPMSIAHAAVTSESSHRRNVSELHPESGQARDSSASTTSPAFEAASCRVGLGQGQTDAEREA